MRTKLNIDSHNIVMSNGVCLASAVHRGWFAVAWYDEHGSLQTKWATKKEIQGKTVDYKKIKIIIFLFILDLMLIPMVVLPIRQILSVLFGLPLLLFPVRVMHFSIVALLMSPEEKCYHGAMHMLLNSWCKKRPVQYMRSLKTFSRFYSHCYTGKLIYIIILSFLIPCIVYGGFGSLGIVNGCIFFFALVLLIDILRRLGLFNVFQHFTTLVPTDHELKAVWVASQLLLEKENE